MSINDLPIEFLEDKPAHYWHSQIPNVFFHFGFDAYTIALYVTIKRITGEGGTCSKSLPNLAKLAGMGVTKCREILGTLSTSDNKYNTPLISVTERKNEKGINEPHIIKILDLWELNALVFKEIKKGGGGSPREGGVVRHAKGGGSPREHKEEPIQEEPFKKDDDVPAEAGGRNGVTKLVVFRHQTKNVVSRKESAIYDYLRSKGYFDSEIETALAEANESDPVLKADNQNVIERYLAATIDKQREKNFREKKINDSKYRSQTRSGNNQQDLIQRSREGFRQEIDLYGCDAR